MIKQVLTTFMIALGIGCICYQAQNFAQSHYLNGFLKDNLINLLVALLAVNSATMGIVLTKIRELTDKHGSPESFTETKEHMLLSIREQIGLIASAIVLLTASSSAYISENENIKPVIATLIITVFAYSLMNLYDMAKSVLVILDYEI